MRTGADDPRDPRAVARRAERYLTTSKIADARTAADVQFFVFDQAVYEQGLHTARYKVDTRARVPGVAAATRRTISARNCVSARATAFPMPADSLQNLRSEMVAALGACSVPVRAHRHGPATGGIATISLLSALLLRLADRLMICKYVVRNVAARHGKVATFMPQPLFGEPRQRFADRAIAVERRQPLLGTAGQSDQGRWAARGWRRHAASLLALTCPTTNSYRRLAAELGGTGGDAALCRAGGRRRRRLDRVHGRRFELQSVRGVQRAAAGGAGRTQRTEPGSLPACLPPVTLDAACRAGVRPRVLAGGRRADGGLVGHMDRAQKRRDEIAALRVRPHPYEFCLYFDEQAHSELWGTGSRVVATDQRSVPLWHACRAQSRGVGRVKIGRSCR